MINVWMPTEKFNSFLIWGLSFYVVYQNAERRKQCTVYLPVSRQIYLDLYLYIDLEKCLLYLQ